MSQEALRSDPGGSNTASIHKAPILISLVIGAFAAILNQTLLNVAIPKLMNDFNVSANTVQWLSTGYMLANGIIIPLTAYLMGTFTTRQLFLGAMTMFGLGSVCCASAPDFMVMMIGRVIQAVGAGMMMPLMMTVIMTLYPPETRGKAMGTIGIAMFFAPAVGPTLSGWIIQNYSWRVLFYIVIPVAIIDIIVASIYLKNVTERTFPKFAFLSFLSSTIGLGALLYGFSEAGSKGWGSGEVIVSVMIGVVFLILFIIRELTTANPLLNLRVFKVGGFSLAAAVSCVVNMAMFGGTLLTPMYIQNLRGYSSLDSGLLMLPGAILMGIMSPVSGALLDKIGIRPLAIVGLLITVITTWDLGHLTPNTPFSHIEWIYTFRMFGMGFIAMTIMTSGLNYLPRQVAAHGTAAANTVRMVAGSLGTSLLVTVMTNRTNTHYNQYINTVTSTNPQLYNSVHTMVQGFAAQLGVPVQTAQTYVTYLMYGQAEKLAGVQGVDDAYLVAAALALLALIMSLFLRRNKNIGKGTPKREPQRALPPPRTVEPNEG
ncbi:DHA2 family efflux MFS transporter permease subunit [Alicyclobacillus fastidiosus]|uniref:DHA2 family efflux MFS transporter permease subunit n=1 Tax=Alicyclobacillus fastidiosus TaxID=392011 RepID=A0ABV5ABP0_9BACL|nr:DHA2 family efflux MFS transporter permease subunit [Alicyclobacillus fastidiosus]WEH10354.1 DHA2 family efflux MFS transporter permease subunit [Alicyclobacillus fastidiosus]